MEKNTEVTYSLDTEEVKQAIVEYMDKHKNEDFALEEISFDCGINQAEEVTSISANCVRNSKETV